MIRNILGMESMNDKMFVRHCIHYEFHQWKSASQTHTSIWSILGGEVVSKSMCEFWFRRFWTENFYVNELEHSGATSKVKSVDLQAQLDNDSSQTQQKLAETLGVCQQAIFKRLRDMGKFKKESGYHINCVIKIKMTVW